MRTGKWHEDSITNVKKNSPVPRLDQIKASCAGGALLSRRRGGNWRGELLIESIVILVHDDELDLIDILVAFKRFHRIGTIRTIITLA